jgi:hypothetical protein
MVMSPFGFLTSSICHLLKKERQEDLQPCMPTCPGWICQMQERQVWIAGWMWHDAAMSRGIKTVFCKFLCNNSFQQNKHVKMMYLFGPKWYQYMQMLFIKASPDGIGHWLLWKVDNEEHVRELLDNKFHCDSPWNLAYLKAVSQFNALGTLAIWNMSAPWLGWSILWDQAAHGVNCGKVSLELERVQTNPSNHQWRLPDTPPK